MTVLYEKCSPEALSPKFSSLDWMSISAQHKGKEKSTLIVLPENGQLISFVFTFVPHYLCTLMTAQSDRCCCTTPAGKPQLMSEDCTSNTVLHLYYTYSIHDKLIRE